MDENKPQPLRFVQPILIAFGGQEFELAPIKGLRNIAAFQSAVTEEIRNLAARVEKHERFGERISMEALLEQGVDYARLLPMAGIPEALLEEATAFEMAGALNIALGLNNMSEMVRFLAPSQLRAVAERVNQRLPDFPLPERSTSSSPPASTGEPSSTN